MINTTNGTVLSAATASTSFVDVVNYVGSGDVSLVAQSDATAGSARVKITIDGVVVLETTGGSGSTSAYNYIGAWNGFASFEAVPFNSSLRIEHKTSNAGFPATTYYKYRKTS
jgi:hypothetical protein